MTARATSRPVRGRRRSAIASAVRWRARLARRRRGPARATPRWWAPRRGRRASARTPRARARRWARRSGPPSREPTGCAPPPAGCVEVVELDARERSGRGLHVARDGGVNDHEAAAADRGGDLRAGEDPVGAGGAGEDQIAPAQLAADLAEADRPAAEAVREILGAVAAPAGHEHGLHAGLHERAGRERPVLAGPDDERAAPVEVAERSRASSTATEATDARWREMPVSVRTRLPARRAAWNTRLRISPLMPSDRASSYERLTCPWISTSPRIIESSPAATRKRWRAAAAPRRVRSARASSSRGIAPARASSDVAIRSAPSTSRAAR